MIIEQNVTMIVSTCRLEESGKTKCNQFWPEDGQVAKYNITQDERAKEEILVTISKFQRQRYLGKREMVAQLPNGDLRKVTNIFFKGWPDHGVPDGDAVKDFGSMLKQFSEWVLKSGDDEKAIVHCSAGIGRTGTTISLMELIINISA